MSRRKQQRPSQLSEDDKESKRNKGDKHSDAISTAGSVKKENPPNVVRRPRGRPRKYNLTPPSLTDGACSVSVASSKATTTTTTTSSEETDNAESVDGSPDVKDEGKGPLTRKRSKMTCFDTPPPEAAAQTNLKMKGGKKAVDLSNKICNVCGKVNKSPSNLERHMRVHTGEKPFACIRCGKAFKCKRSQQTHQYLCHGITDGISQSRLEMLQATRRRMDVDSEGNADVEMDGFKCLSGMKSPHTEAQMCNSMSLPVCGSSKADGEAKCLDGSNVTCYSSEQEASKPMNLTTTDKSQRIEPCFTGVAKADSSNNELPSHHPTSNADARGTAENVAHKSEGTHVLCEHCGQGFNSAQNLALHQQSFHNAKILTAASSENPNPAPKRRRGRPPSTVHLERPTMVPVPKVTERSIDCSLDNMNLLSGVASSISRNESEGINLDHGLSFAPFKDSNMNHALGMQHQHFATDRRESLGEPNLFVCSQNLESSSQFGDPNKTHCAATDANGNIAQGHLLNPGTQLLTMVGLVEQQNSFVWQSIKVQSEKPLVTRLEGMHCATEQSYVLYKCCLCGNAFPGLAMLSSHLTAHIRNNKEHCCEKCGACFKWRSQLQVHEQVHQVIDNKLAMASPMVPQNFLVMNPAMNLRMPPNCSPPPGAMHSPHSAIQTNPSAVTTSNCTQNLSSLAHIHSPNQCISPHSPSAISQSNCETMVGRKGRRGAVKHKLPFNCKYCPKSFDRVFSLQRHERIHTGVKPCFCKVCGRGFSERRNLRHHMIRFHSDNNERELLRRSRRQARQRGNSTSQRLVSFLKKTAVRILNSMDQSRLDPPMSPQDGEMMQPVDGTIPETAMTNEMVPHSAEQDRNDAGHNPSSQIKLEHEEEKVTVVFPTDAPDKCSNTPEPSDPAPSSNAEEQVEVLKDPKRSLMGNRRKGRPFKYTPCQGVMPREDSAIVHSEKSKSEYSSQSPVSNQPNPTTDGLAIGGEPLPSSEINENQAHTNEEAQQASEAENPKDPSSKTRIPGHGAFFSSYNPRLGVVEKPIARAEACRPHLSSDGKHIYPCSYCFKTFCSTSDLNRHMDFHEDIRPFKCRYCEYYSRTISQIKVHMMRHQGIKQFLCQMCNYNGVTQSDLNRHCKTRNHVLRAKNVCSYCGLGFYTRTLLEEHVRMFHHSGDLQQASFYNGQQAEPRMNCEESITEASVLAQPVQQSFTDTPDKSGPFTNAGSANSDIPLQAKFSVEDNNNDYAFGSKNDAVSNAVLDKQSKAVEDDDNEALNLSSAKT